MDVVTMTADAFNARANQRVGSRVIPGTKNTANVKFITSIK